MARIASDLTWLIGGTPVVRLAASDPGRTRMPGDIEYEPTAPGI